MEIFESQHQTIMFQLNLAHLFILCHNFCLRLYKWRKYLDISYYYVQFQNAFSFYQLLKRVNVYIGPSMSVGWMDFLHNGS